MSTCQLDGIRGGYRNKSPHTSSLNLAYSRVVKTQSAKTWPNFNFQGEGGVFLGSQNSKCQVLTKFQFSGEEEGLFLGSHYSRIGYSWIFEHKIFLLKIWSA